MVPRPIRVQLSRRKGFRLADAADNGLPTVKVARPGLLGNPFQIGVHGNREHCVMFHRALIRGKTVPGLTISPADQLKWLDRALPKIADLPGKNVACFCGLDEPCHGDNYLGIAS